MNKDRREPEYPTELESQLILRLPEEPAKMLREVLQTGENLKNRLTIDIDNDMRNGEVRFDHWLMHGKIVDLPTIVESLKTIDNKSFYKTADVSQMMICKEGPEQPAEEEPTKNKKKDPYKVDKKFLWPHGITPPTKNVRKRRFRKTLKKKYVEAPEIEKEVKRLLRADNEALSVSWEVINEEDDQAAIAPKLEQPPPPPPKPEKKSKAERAKKEPPPATITKPDESSNVVDIFGGAVSDSDNEEDHVNVESVEHPHHLSPYDGRVTDSSSIAAAEKQESFTLKPEPTPVKKSKKKKSPAPKPSTSEVPKVPTLTSEDDGDSKDNMSLQIEQVRTELEVLKQRRKKTQLEIAGMENLALRQRFQDILHTLNQDIMYKEMEYQGMITFANSEDI